MPDQITVDTSELDAVLAGFGTVGSWHKQVTDKHMHNLGRRIAAMVRLTLQRHRYTGAMEESVDYLYHPSSLVVEIGPTVKRGSYDGGLILEKGTRPIPALPFEPIARWAEFRGLPAGAVWMSIKQRGVKPHPWLDRALQKPGTQRSINIAAKSIGMDFLANAVRRMPTPAGGVRNVVSSQMGFSSGQ